MYLYQVIYKCRLCGEVFYHDECNEKEVGEAGEVFLENCHDIWIPHECEDGSFGVADFQGFKKVGD